MRILFLLPFKIRHFDAPTLRTARASAQPGTEIHLAHARGAPDSIWNQADAARAIPCILDAVSEAEATGYDAVVISCFGDPGLHEAHANARIPIVGTTEAQMLLGASVGLRFSAIVLVDSLVSSTVDFAATLGIRERLSSVRFVTMEGTVLSEEERTRRTCEEAVRAVTFDGADTVLLGCTCMVGLEDPVRAALCTAAGAEIPVIDPIGAPLKIAEAEVSLRIRYGAGPRPGRHWREGAGGGSGP